MNISVVCTSVNDICGIDKTILYQSGVNIVSFLSVDSSVDNLKNALKYAFENSDGVCVIYSKQSWSNLQKAMLMEFERSSIFVEAETPYVIANGFKEILEGVYFDTVYNKPFMFVSNELKEDIDIDIISSLFSDKLARVGIFDEKIQSKDTVFIDEVETVIVTKFANINKLIKSSQQNKIYTTKGESPALALFNTLKDKNVTIAAAESCTSGMIAASITDIPGSSNYFLGGCAVYSNEFKSRFIGVNTNTLNSFGAVSKEVAIQMAIGVLNNSNADFSVAVTGIAGPKGATNDKPVGLVYISAASRYNTDVRKKVFTGNRKMIRHKTTKFALLFLRDFILAQ